MKVPAVSVTVDRMPYGRFRGQCIIDLPTDYITWLLNDTELNDDDLETALRNQLKLRAGQAVVVKRG